MSNNESFITDEEAEQQWGIINDSQTDFDKKLEQIFDEMDIYSSLNNFKIVIKQAVDKYVIGEDEVFIDIPVVGITGETESIISGKSFFPLMVAKNQFRIQQRLALYGGKNNVTR